MEILIQAVGWFGTLLIVSAYYLISHGKVSGSSKVYQAVNLIGSVCVGINVFHQHSWPAVALQVAWSAIAIFALVKIYKTTTKR